MPFIHREDKILYAENVSLQKIAEEVGTPCYVYSKKAIIENYNAFLEPLKQSERPFQLHYAVKANSNLAILNLLAKLNAGFEIVSHGELARVLKAGANVEHIIFSGVGKTTEELKEALSSHVGIINIESASEMTRLNELAKALNTKPNVMIRINPDIKTNNHPYIATGHNENKFGISIPEAKNLITLQFTNKHFPNLNIVGLSCHIGSQILELKPFLDAIEKVCELREQLESIGISLPEMNFGGGLGVCYKEELPPTPKAYIESILSHCQKFYNASPFRLHLEPGRAIVANAGILLTQVEYIKHHFAIIDAAMNDLMRPALYHAEHNIYPVVLEEGPNTPNKQYDIVGPICESGDFLAKNRMLSLKENSYLAVFGAGAYGFSMSSNYNSRPRAAEVMVDNNQYFIVRSRETIESLFANENMI